MAKATINNVPVTTSPIPYIVNNSAGEPCRPVKVKAYGYTFQCFTGEKRLELFDVDVRKAFADNPSPSACREIMQRQMQLQAETGAMWAPIGEPFIWNLRALVPLASLAGLDQLVLDNGQWVVVANNGELDTESDDYDA